MRTVPRKRIKFERKLYVIVENTNFSGWSGPQHTRVNYCYEQERIPGNRIVVVANKENTKSQKSTRRNQSGSRALDDVEDCDDKGDDNPDKEDNNGEEDNDDDEGRVVCFANVGKHNC